MTTKLHTALDQGVEPSVLPNPDNAFRFRTQPQWFDFYNCRVVLPDQDVFFFVMPYLLSGENVPSERAGLYVLDGGNGGPDRRMQTGIERIGTTGWSASTEGCGVQWTQGAEAHVFTETYIRMASPNARWDVRIEPFLSDRAAPVTDLRRFDIEEKLILRRVPFIHRVPHMKGFASGVIDYAGQRYAFDRGIVYQAKNHGPTLPERWTWIHANAFAEDETLAFEVASNPATGGDAAMLRIIRPGAHQTLTTWEGAAVHLTRTGDGYTFSGASADGSLTVSGEATHGDAVVFRVPAPSGDAFEIDEDLLGVVSVEINGETFTTRHAAVGIAHHLG
jgi:hypothetical protein